MEQGLEILDFIKNELDLPVLSDVHETNQVEKAAEVLDIIQIPAFLCRQTDLIVAAAKTQKAINLKKGQFLSPYEMKKCRGKSPQSKKMKISSSQKGEHPLATITWSLMSNPFLS